MKLVQSFDDLPTWQLIAGGAVSKQFPVCWTLLFDEFRLFDNWLSDSNCFPRWYQQTGSGLPDWSLVCPTVKIVVENYFQFAAATVENGLNGLS